jgi:hypothetical protein
MIGPSDRSIEWIIVFSINFFDSWFKLSNYNYVIIVLQKSSTSILGVQSKP